MPKDLKNSKHKDAIKLLNYWRASISDSMFGKGRFKKNEIKGREPLSAHAFKEGRISPRQTEKFFKDRHEETVPIRLWPHVYARRVVHGTMRQDGLPDAIAPFVSEAVLTRDGYIRPGRTLIPRDILEPLTSGAFSIGTVEAQDNYLTHSDFGSTDSILENAKNWSRYLEFCDQLLNAVAADWLKEDGNFTEHGPGFFEASDVASAMTKGILALYDNVLKRNDIPPLLHNYARVTPHRLSANLARPYALGERLGHSNDKFPVAQNQRDVLAHMAKAEHGEIIAVNGPPGTGKTTLLLSAIASAWVKAAAEENDPPVIIAASANNQAVTNIIDAFGKDYAEGTGPFSGRWLPDIKSFGLFLSSAAREEEASKRYHTESFFKKLETQTYVSKARAIYLDKACKAFNDETLDNVKHVTARLHEEITAKIRQMENVDDAYTEAHHTQAKLESELGSNIASALKDRKTRLQEAQQKTSSIKALASRWGRHVATESTLLGIFSFLPSIARKRLAGALNVFREAGFDDLADTMNHISACRSEIIRLRDAAKSEQLQASQSVKRAQAVITNHKVANERLKTIVSRLSPELVGSDISDIDSFMDCHVRFPLFLIATHYWEGRWLLEMENILPDVDAEKKRTGKKSVIPRWHRRMMLTPCAVATFATLPSKMTCRVKRGNAFVDDYLYEFIDLLIIDEAGQVLPEVAAPSLALAKQALVVGDSQQIEPISNIQKITDLGNLTKFGVVPEEMDEATLTGVLSSGFLSHTGSVMACAQNACLYQPYPDLDRGLYLFEHRRCYDEIIAFCNALCYQGHLQPKRGPAEGTEVPPMGYLHIDGATFSAGGSRFNPTEARTIAAWLAATRASLEQHYSEKLESILAIVTPFGQQARELRQACAAVGIRTEGIGAITIGTVHALQGAERPIVLFSPVYTKGADGGFIDISPSMLNVAVSRAKDNFLVFGDMDLFSIASHDTPRGLLGRFLFAQHDNALEFDVQPREDLKQNAAHIRMLRDADAHDIFLRDTLTSAQKAVEIISPWIIKATMEKNGFMTLMQDAVVRGVTVDVYADPTLNTKMNSEGISQFDEAAAALSGIGVTLHPVRQLHSKIVCADGDVFCIGSFNWLSADRVGRYARHETSLVYSGAHMAKEIERFRQNLELRSA